MAGETNNKVLYGIEQCYIAKITETDGEITYGHHLQCLEL